MTQEKAADRCDQLLPLSEAVIGGFQMMGLTKPDAMFVSMVVVSKMFFELFSDKSDDEFRAKVDAGLDAIKGTVDRLRARDQGQALAAFVPGPTTIQ